MSGSLIYVAAGFMVGGLVGLTGVGGGSIMTPLLMLLFGQSPAVAVGTDLMFSATTKIAATISFGYARRIDWTILRRLAMGSIPGAASVLVWFWATRHSPGVVDRVIPRCLGIALAVTAIGLLLQTRLLRFGPKSVVAPLERSERYKPLITAVVGIVLGVAVTLTSVGAGALGTVALFWLYPRRLTGDKLVATDIAHALPITLIAGIGHATLGHVNVPVLASLLVGSIPGVLLASRAAIRLPTAVTRVLIAIVLLLVSQRMLVA
jgi:uncharacterized membrane protein YfcA